MQSSAPLYRVLISVTLCVILGLPAALGLSQEERIWSPKLVKETLDNWSEKYPQLFRTASVQEKYSIPHAGNVTDCSYDENDGCSQYFFTVQDFIRHPEGSRSSAHLPEVFWSGTLHGDEIEGPSVVMEATKMLLESAACEATPGPNPSASDIQAAKACRIGLGERGISDARRQWLARLAATRRVVVLPSANALGYSSGTRDEDGIDPARDFPYAVGSESTECMQSTASRAINEIFRDHMFQIALSFYSGSGAIGFSWRGEQYTAPDKQTQIQIAKALGSTAVDGELIYEGARPNTFFENGDTLVDYVTTRGPSELRGYQGSFEDWAYAGSWGKNTSTCSPQTYGGYLPEKTQYNNSTNRALALMTSINKATIEKSMASNVNLALASLDLVQPYVNVFGVNNLALADDIVPMNEAMSSSCLKTRSVVSSARGDSLAIEWTVGGSLYIDYTDLFYAVNLSEDEEQALDCLTQPDDVDLSNFVQATSDSKSGGSGLYSEPGADPSPDSSRTKKGDVLGPVFKAEIDIKDMKAGDRIVIIASARVDQNWNLPHAPNVIVPSPESHLANARTNPDWNHLHNGKRIRGRINWFSIPLAVVLEDFDNSLGTLEMENRFSQSTDSDTEKVQDQEEATQEPLQKKPKIDEQVHGDTEEYTIASKINENVASRLIWHSLTTLVLFLVLIVLIYQAKKRKLMDQMQSVMHAQRSAEERADPHSPNEEEIIEFGNIGIYNKKINRTTARSDHLANYECEVVGDIEDDTIGIYREKRSKRTTLSIDRFTDADSAVVGDVENDTVGIEKARSKRAPVSLDHFIGDYDSAVIGDIEDDTSRIYEKKQSKRTPVSMDHFIDYDSALVGDIDNDENHVTEVVGDIEDDDSDFDSDGASDGDSNDDSDDDDDHWDDEYAPAATLYAPPSPTRYSSQSMPYTSPEDLDDVYIA
ncbi:unnamed protein product [Cylindrotheca closterium]|uniref:Peptidase M14 domain-containing protein n=1 Tax=Cylindrotheca closterium TaxID=2856 RepID=A0AAD2CRF0_9STRA|nr:unnamed protein product [Cylindrotheca closterium]